jgi:hypothetical protein
MSALCQQATLRKPFPRRPVQDFTAQAALPHPANPFGAVPSTPTKIADAANGMVRRCSCPQGKLALIIDNLHNFRRNTARSHQDFSTNRWAKILKADQGRGRMPEGARGAEYSNAQEARADRPQPKRSWFAKAANWLLSLRWIRTTKRITADYPDPRFGRLDRNGSGLNRSGRFRQYDINSGYYSAKGVGGEGVHRRSCRTAITRCNDAVRQSREYEDEGNGH